MRDAGMLSVHLFTFLNPTGSSTAWLLILRVGVEQQDHV